MMAGGDGISAVAKAMEIVDALYRYRDRYFENHTIEQAAQKGDDVVKQLNETVDKLSSLQDAIPSKAQYLLQYGRALNVLPTFNSTAQESLAKAVKLDPTLVDAWNNLGECYWKNKDIASAKNCFTGALTHSKNKVSLRNLSMVLRQLGRNNQERFMFVEESVEKAKEAVPLDITDGTSWFVLGNAYLSLFFASNQSPKVLKLCMSAYSQADKDIIAATNPDLHYNRATAYKYQEEYRLALVGFARAAALDPSWPEPKEKEKQLIDYLKRVQDLVQTRGKCKGKKLQTMVKSLSNKDLGPYEGGSYTSPHDKTIKLEVTDLDQLHNGVNAEKVVMGKVVGSVTTDEPVPFTFCMVDSKETCYAATIYNIAPGYGVKIGDAVAIPEPFIQSVDISWTDENFKFSNIRIDSPVVMVVNGRKLGVDKQAPSVLALTTMSE